MTAAPAFKFLRRGGRSPFRDVAWPRPEHGRPGRWLEADGPIEPCRAGVHACRAGELPLWLADELWIVELAAPVVDAGDKVVAPAGRLRRRVVAWDAEAAARFARECAERATRAADAAAPEALATAEGPDLHGYAADAAGAAEAARAEPHDAPVRAAAAAYVARVVAGAAGGRGARAAEQAWQASWLLRLTRS